MDTIKLLEEHPKSTAVKQPLQHNGNLLWKSDYHQLAEEYRNQHPDEEIASGTPQQHSAHVKAAFRMYLKAIVASYADDEVQGLSPTDQVLTAAEEQVTKEAAAKPVPDSDYGARQRVYQQIVRRRGQGKFRSALVKAYAGGCAVTGNNATDALEAAHLIPYRGPESNTVTN